VYNKVGEISKNSTEVGDVNALINIFKRRFDNEIGFCYDFEINPDGSLVSFFWRDRQIEDYNVSRIWVVFNSMHRTKKYNMIFAPFVEMDHHCKNMMFSCGFILNKKIDSFIWLFRTFFKSMTNKHLITIMPYQDLLMATTIQEVFPKAHHRLSCRHIIENFKKNIGALRSKEGLVKSSTKFLCIVT